MPWPDPAGQDLNNQAASGGTMEPAWRTAYADTINSGQSFPWGKKPHQSGGSLHPKMKSTGVERPKS
jgi:hypothetical protein